MNNLSPYPKYKPSGVEWLGEVPAHWEVKATKQGFGIQLGKMLQPYSKSPQDSEVPYFKAQHVQWETVSTEDPTVNVVVSFRGGTVRNIYWRFACLRGW